MVPGRPRHWLKSLFDVEADLASGALVELLSDYSAGDIDLRIVYPASAVQPRRVRTLIDCIAKTFEPAASVTSSI